MKRVMVISFVLLTAIGAALAGFGYWGLGTTPGTRWLAATAGRLAGIELTTVQLDGTLFDGLDLTGLRIAWQGGEIHAEHLSLTIHPASLWSATLAIENLEIDRLILQIEEREEEQVPVGPETKSADAAFAAIPTWFTVTIDRLQIKDFITRKAGDSEAGTVIANLIAGQYRLAGQHLTGQDFSYHSPYVELDGSFDWELTQPHLVMTAQVHLPETSADRELFETLKLPFDFPAQLELDGDWNGYTGSVRFGVIDEKGDSVRLSARASGSWRGIHFEDLKGRYLGGELAGSLELAWIDVYRMQGALSAQNLDLSALIKETTGKSTFDVAGELLISYDDRPLQANLTMQLHEGRFRGHALQGQAAGQWTGRELNLLDVDLYGDGARLLAKGVPAEKVEVDLEVADLAAFHAELAGQLSARGWLRWANDTLAGEIDGQGENLAWQEIGVRTLVFHGRHQGGEENIAITLSGEDWRHGTFTLERASADVSGTLAAHRIELAAQGPFGRFRATATGTYAADNWTGHLVHLTGDDTPWGIWSMPQPAALAWVDGVVDIDSLKLAGDRNRRLQLDVKGWNSPDRASVSLAWTALELAWLQPYAGLTLLSGRVDGQVHYTMRAGQPSAITGQLTAHGRIEDELFELDYEALDLHFSWDQNGLGMTANARTDGGESLLARAKAPGPLQWVWPIAGLSADLQWQKLDLARLGRFLDDISIEGRSDGALALVFAEEQLSRLTGNFSAHATLTRGDRKIGVRSLQADLDWGAGGFQGTARAEGDQIGQVALRLTSPERPALAWPEAGQVNLEVKKLSLTALDPLLPQDLELAGYLDGHANGSWRDRGTLDMSGRMHLVESHIGWSSEDGQIHLPLRDAAADWTWRDAGFSGSFIMNLAEHGDLKGSWQLPLPARLPIAFNPDGRMQLNVDGRMQAKGLMSAVGPWMVQDLRGTTQVNLALQGTWARPDLRGRLAFTDGGAYLPGAGVQLDNINIRGELDGDRLRIEQLEIHSGPGVLNGQGELVFTGWALEGYRLDIVGKDLQVVNFPELQVICNPDLSLSGTAESLSVRGSVLIPVMTIRDSTAEPEVLPSKDVVIVTTEKQPKELGFTTDVHVVVELGDDVTVSSGGLETKLAGGVIVTMDPTGNVLAEGEIQLVSGSYRAYGTRLQIRQGGLLFRGGSITNPDLRIFAARQVGEVLAGVQVTGSAEAQVVTLYSRPTMSERDILGYILMGRALRSDSLNTDILMMGAGTLLPVSGEGLSRLGIAEIDIQGLFSGLGGVRLRRQFAENWEVESTLGVESGVDLYYIFEFE